MSRAGMLLLLLHAFPLPPEHRLLEATPHTTQGMGQDQFHKQRRYPKPASGVNRQPAPALLLTITPTTAKVQIPTRYGPRLAGTQAH